MDGFRRVTREWLEDNCPSGMRIPSRGDADICWGGGRWLFQSPDQKVWLERMAARGWTVPTWPKAYGGGGLSPSESAVLKEEMDRIGARSPLDSFGISMLGPALLEFGTEEQKKKHLPRIARGEVRWCQGYSEPGAGSDLAAVRTRADIKGKELVVNGQKIWTSYADQSDWIFCLVRTDPLAKKQMGITFCLIDMTSEGVTTRPIVLISGKSPFCETFFDDVRVPAENVVGSLNQGWDVAKYLLTHEREMIAGGGSSLFDVDALNHAAMDEASGSGGRLRDEVLRAKIAATAIDTFAFEATRQRYLNDVENGNPLGDRSALLKLCGTELNKTRQELLMELGGLGACEWRDDDTSVDACRHWLRSKGNSIEGGTSEIMREIIARRILDLPSS